MKNDQSKTKNEIYIIQVAPIGRGISKERLSYFSTLKPEIGTLVSVPVRKKSSYAIVLKVDSATKAKAELKSLPYGVRKLDKFTPTTLIAPGFIKAAHEAGQYFASTTGAILNSFIPKIILDQAAKISLPLSFTKPGDISPDKLVLQADEEERFANYKSLTREQFARKESVFFCLPTIEEIKRAKSLLEKGIEKYTFILHSNLKKEEVVKTWKKILETKHPVLIIATGSFLSVPRHDLGLLVLERESSRAYKINSRPYADIRIFAEIYARVAGIKLLLGDTALRVETTWRHKKGEVAEFGSLKFRSLSSATARLIDLRHERPDKNDEFRAVSPELIKLITKNKERNENLLIFGARKGLFPMTICSDCGTPIKCSNCNALMVLHSSSKQNFFSCHRCGEKRDATDKCVSCRGWRLATLGIGIERLETEIREAIPDIKLFRLDKDSANTYKKATTVAEKFLDTPGSVLLGTEMALLYVRQKIDNTAVAAIDSMFSIPDFKINEQIFHILLYLRSLAQKNFIVQTRNISEPLFEHALKGNLLDFYRHEIDQRRLFDYPPFSVFIKLTLEGTKYAVTKEMELVADLLKGYEINIFPSLTVSRGKQYALNALIKMPQAKWPDPELVKRLNTLSPQFTIKVDPENLL